MQRREKKRHTSREEAGGARFEMFPKIPTIAETVVQLDELEFFASSQG